MSFSRREKIIIRDMMCLHSATYISELLGSSPYAVTEQIALIKEEMRARGEELPSECDCNSMKTATLIIEDGGSRMMLEEVGKNTSYLPYTENIIPNLTKQGWNIKIIQ